MANAEINQVRPTSLDGIVGQASVIDQIRVGLAAANADDGKFPHSLLCGPPGLGKSLCAAVVAKEIGGELHETLAQSVTTPAEMHSLLLGAGDRDVIFLDECHELAFGLQTILYRALDERTIWLQPEVSQFRPKSVPLGDFTLLLATTDEFCLLQPLRDRMRLTLRFDYYDPDDLATLTAQRASLLGWQAEGSVLEQIARFGRGTPRIALRLLEAAWRVARSEGDERITGEHFARCCQLQGLDKHGLNAVEQKYLLLLYKARGAIRLNILAMKLGLPPRTISEVVEAFLLRAGLIQREDQGRRLTSDGWQYVAAQVDPATFRRYSEHENNDPANE